MCVCHLNTPFPPSLLPSGHRG